MYCCNCGTKIEYVKKPKFCANCGFSLDSTIEASQTKEREIEEKEEIGKCFIKYPLLMKCDYQNLKQKSVISDGKTVAIIKKKYKKIYYYPIKTTPLFTILKKEKILYVIRNNKPTKIDSNIIEFEFVDKKSNKLFSKIFFKLFAKS